MADDPHDPDAHNGAGLVEQELCRFKAAVGHYRAVLSHDPEQIDARLNLGFCLQEVGELEGAIEVYREALQRDRALYPLVLKTMTTAARGQYWLRPSELRARLLG